MSTLIHNTKLCKSPKILGFAYRVSFFALYSFLLCSCEFLDAVDASRGLPKNTSLFAGAASVMTTMGTHRRQRSSELDEDQRAAVIGFIGLFMAESINSHVNSKSGQSNPRKTLKEGFRCPGNMVISPYRPKARPVPIKLLPPPPVNVMICPYSKEKFIVPPEVRPVPPEEGGGVRGPMEGDSGIRPTSTPQPTIPIPPKKTLSDEIRSWLEKDSPPEASPDTPTTKS